MAARASSGPAVAAVAVSSDPSNGSATNGARSRVAALEVAGKAGSKGVGVAAPSELAMDAQAVADTAESESGESGLSGKVVDVFPKNVVWASAISFVCGLPTRVRLHDALAADKLDAAALRGIPAGGASPALSPAQYGSMYSARSNRSTRSARETGELMRSAGSVLRRSGSTVAPAMAMTQITDADVDDMDMIALRREAECYDPWVPRPLLRSTKGAMLLIFVSVAAFDAIAGFAFYRYGTGSSTAANIQIAVILSVSYLMGLSCALLCRFWQRGAYQWVFRRAMAEATHEELQRYMRIMSLAGMLVLQDTVGVGFTNGPVLSANLSFEAFSTEWWVWSTSIMIPSFVASGFVLVVLPLVGLRLMLPIFLRSRLVWLRTARPSRQRAITVYWEAANVMNVISAELTPPMILVLIVAVTDVVLMSLFLASEPLTTYAFIFVMPACAALVLLIMLLYAQITRKAEDFAADFLLIFDSLGTKTKESSPLDSLDPLVCGAGSPVTWQGFIASMRSRPLALRVAGVPVTFASLLRLVPVMLGAVSLAARGVVTQQT